MRHFRYTAFSPNKEGFLFHLMAVASKVYLIKSFKCLLHSLVCIFDSIITKNKTKKNGHLLVSI